MSDLARERLASLQRGIERGRNLLDQLLTLAKAQASPDLPKSPVSVQGIYRRVLEDLIPLAEARRIDIGVEGEQDAQVMVSELDMIAVVKNLVDNAIRYTPEGGRVDLSVTTVEGRAVLRIHLGFSDEVKASGLCVSLLVPLEYNCQVSTYKTE